MIEFLMIQGGILGQTELTPADKLVVSYLAFRQGTNGTCWPPVELIAGELALSRSTVKRSVAKLTRRGYLIKKAAHGGRFQSNSYIVKMEYLRPGAAAPHLDQAPAVRAADSLFRSGEKHKQDLRRRLLARVEGARQVQRQANAPPPAARPIPSVAEIQAGRNIWRKIRGLPPLEPDLEPERTEHDNQSIAASG
ncbi:MAG TPA: helix-turn-helix domain-containing protein [Anaerohalosphaeraceae bacterium]|nr:helix-turn-helix domain-containing protein [Anaerohalosphaeraceae bacterium]